MEEQTTWKGHSLTLLVFVGIVVLCSIFFILGMLVGRQQGQNFATVAEADAASVEEARPAPEEKPELTFFESVEKETKPAVLEAPPAAPPPAPAPAPRPAPQPAPTILNYQIAALRKASDADKLLDDVKKKGFKAFILAPASGDANPFFRVQVGPFPNLIEAEDARKRLEGAGYKPILRK